MQENKAVLSLDNIFKITLLQNVWFRWDVVLVVAD